MKQKLKYVYREVDRHGQVRHYYREGGRGARIPLPDPSSPDFAAAYAAAAGTAAYAPRKPKEAKPTSNPLQVKVGTLKWLCTKYMNSPEFKQLDEESTQRTRRRTIDSCLAEPIAPGATETFADFPLDRITPKAIRVLRDRKADEPCAANQRVKVMGYVFQWGLEAEPDYVTSNPARDVAKLRPKNVGGFHSWTLEEVRRYERTHKVGTQARLALALLLYTGQRKSDIVRMGPPMVGEDGWLHFRQYKNRNRNPVDLSLPIIPALREIIDATSPVGTKTWLVTSFGKPFSIKGFGNKFREWCNKAGLPHCTSHGLRKAASARLAELGCTPHEIMAITGHRSMAEVDRYTRAARQKVLARSVERRVSRR